MIEDERERVERMAREGVRFLPVGLSPGIRKEIVVDLDQSLPLLNAREEERQSLLKEEEHLVVQTLEETPLLLC